MGMRTRDNIRPLWIIPGMMVWKILEFFALSFVYVEEWLEEKWLNRQKTRYARAAVWIAERLREQGIAVTYVKGWHDCPQVIADVPEECILLYGNVYASAVRMFPRIPLDVLCRYADPMEHLNRAWAERHGFSEWAEEVRTLPCVECSLTEFHQYVFGKRRLAFVRDILSRAQYQLYFADGTERSGGGHFCRACLDRLGYVRGTFWSNPDGSILTLQP